jgi:aminopeptidase
LTDLRVEKLAKILVHHSLRLERGERFIIFAKPLAEPLVEAVYSEAVRAGAHAGCRISLGCLGDSFYRYADDDQVKFVWENDKQLIEETDAALYIEGSYNTRAGSGYDSAKRAARVTATSGLFKRRLERAAAGEFKWAITLFPTPADAQEADMSTRDFEDFVYAACLCETEEPVEEWRRLDAELSVRAAWLSERDEFRVVAEDTDLTFNTGKRKWAANTGVHNIPDGEVCTAPLEASAEGCISFKFPTIYNSREVEDIFLRFEKGVVVEARARRGQDILEEALSIDEGARRVGEAAIGCNYSIQKYSKNILFDEKIGGTVHFALGSSIFEVGGTNKSGIHWDMICDLRPGGEYYADGTLFYKDGKFLEL